MNRVIFLRSDILSRPREPWTVTKVAGYWPRFELFQDEGKFFWRVIFVKTIILSHVTKNTELNLGLFHICLFLKSSSFDVVFVTDRKHSVILSERNDFSCIYCSSFQFFKLQLMKIYYSYLVYFSISVLRANLLT